MTMPDAKEAKDTSPYPCEKWSNDSFYFNELVKATIPFFKGLTTFFLFTINSCYKSALDIHIETQLDILVIEHTWFSWRAYIWRVWIVAAASSNNSWWNWAGHKDDWLRCGSGGVGSTDRGTSSRLEDYWVWSGSRCKVVAVGSQTTIVVWICDQRASAWQIVIDWTSKTNIAIYLRLNIQISYKSITIFSVWISGMCMCTFKASCQHHLATFKHKYLINLFRVIINYIVYGIIPYIYIKFYICLLISTEKSDVYLTINALSITKQSNRLIS